MIDKVRKISFISDISSSVRGRAADPDIQSIRVPFRTPQLALTEYTGIGNGHPKAVCLTKAVSGHTSIRQFSMSGNATYQAVDAGDTFLVKLRRCVIPSFKEAVSINDLANRAKPSTGGWATCKLFVRGMTWTQPYS